MILLDEKENLIHAIIRKHLTSRFEQTIREETIESRINDTTILTDVVGCLRGGCDTIDVVGQGWKKRDLKILTNYSKNCNITLWGKLELVETEWDSNLQEYIVTVRARIAGIDNTFGWNYISCKICLKKVTSIDGAYRCDFCKKTIDYPLVMFKIHVIVKDETGDTTVVLFNKLEKAYKSKNLAKNDNLEESPEKNLADAHDCNNKKRKAWIVDDDDEDEPARNISVMEDID
ncbi:hypothetical protein POM88_046743 [Heracleum sosnowskyi]|uniref:Replication factor A C-terminal domain-containing protein n=1 Tax=Heracleum sosnowskyi TaxID=360622 RepID=A0AAD8M767_9APIA|nr:hypothetical protein POM88_046743 [Heracleum sosnowskyi]